MAEDTQPPTGESAMRRADAAFDQAGERIGALAAQARMRLQELATRGAQVAQMAAQQAADRADQAQAQAQRMTQHNTQDQSDGATDSGSQPTEGAGDTPQAAPDALSPAMQRADVLVDAAAQRLSVWGVSASKRMQIMLARLREEGDDIWAEAQSIRRQDTQVNQDTSGSPQP